jgi:lipopolysaccharide export system permease protein
MTILDRTLFKEMFLSFGAIMSVLTLITVGHLFIKLMSRAADGRYPVDVVPFLMVLGFIKVIVQLMPLALFLGVILSLGRMYRDSEMTAIRACGVGMTKLYRPIMLLAIPGVTVLAALVLYVAPASIRMADRLAFESEFRPNISGMLAGRFIESKHGKFVVYAEDIDTEQRTMRTIFVSTRDKGITAIETAAEARQYTDTETGHEWLELRDGHRFEGVAGKGEYKILSFDKHSMRIPALEGIKHKFDQESRPTSALWGSDQPADQAELQWRLSAPIGAFLLILLALPLSHTSKHGGRFT